MKLSTNPDAVASRHELVQLTGQVTKPDRSEGTSEPDRSGPGERDLEIARMDDFGKPNPPPEPAKKAEPKGQRAVRRFVGRHAYDVSPSHTDVKSDLGRTTTGRQQWSEERGRLVSSSWRLAKKLRVQSACPARRVTAGEAPALPGGFHCAWPFVITFK